MFDFDDLNNGCEGFPEKKILIKVGKEQLKKGIPEEEVLGESLEFVASIASSQCSEMIDRSNKQIAEGIRDLTRFEKWINLSRVSEHAMKSAVRSLDITIPNDIQEVYKLKLKVLTSNIPEIKKMFNEQWLKENYPYLFQDQSL